MTASLSSDVGAITKQQTSVSKQSNPSLHCCSKLMGLGSTRTPIQHCMLRLLGPAQVSDILSPWWHMNGWGIHKLWQKNNEQIVKYLAKCMPGVHVVTLPCEMQKSYSGRLQQWIHAGYRMPVQTIMVRLENHWKSITSLTLIRIKSIVPRSRTSTNWNDTSTASGPLWVWVIRIQCAVGEWHNIYALAFVLEADILSKYCNKDDVMWYVWLFWETITASHVIVCCHSVNHSNIHLIIAFTAQSDTSNFPR